MIGNDLIPRAAHDEPRYAGVDLMERGRNYRVWLYAYSEPSGMAPEVEAACYLIWREAMERT